MNNQKNRPINSRPLKSLATFCIPLICLLLLLGTTVRANPLSVEEWNAQEDKWSELAKSKTTIRVEGRVSTISKDQLRLLACEMPFRSENGKLFKRPQRKHFNVLVSGHLERRQGQLEFIVSRMYPAPSDISQFEIRSKKIKKNDPQQWYDLSQWAAHRADYYGDEVLQQKAQDAWLNGLKAERALLKEDDAKSLFALAEKLKAAKLKIRLQMEYKHTAYRYLWNQEKKDKQQDRTKFLALLLENFSGCLIPLKPTSEKQNIQKIELSYQETPVKTYQSSDDQTRSQLHRLFYREVLLPTLIKDAKTDPRLGYQIAENIDQLIPEESALGEQLRRKELAYRLEHVQMASRTQLLSLKHKYLDRKQQQLADFVVTKWLTHREQELRKAGPTGFVRAAKYYLDDKLKKNEQKAVLLLLAAFKQNQQTPDVADELVKLGYHYHQKKWLTSEEYKHRKINPITQAMQDGIAIEGMTRAQVKAAKGNPTSIYRMISYNAISEIWVYRDDNSNPVTVHLLQSNPKNTTAHVVKIKQIKPR